MLKNHCPPDRPAVVFHKQKTMRTKLMFLLLLAGLFSLSACGDAGTTAETDTDPVEQAQEVNEERLEDDQQLDEADFLVHLSNASRQLYNASNLYLDHDARQPELVQLAEEMQSVQALVLTDAQKLAQARGIVLPEQLGTQEDEEVAGLLAKINQDDFGGEFYQFVEDKHGDMQSAVNGLKAEDSAADMQQFAAQVESYLQQHELLLKRLDEQIQ